MKSRARLWSLVFVGVVLAVAAVVLSQASRVTPFVRDRVVEALNARFASQVALDELQLSVFPRPSISGSGLLLRHNGRTDVPPLLQIPSFSASAGFWGLYNRPLRLTSVELDGLDIHIPVGGVNPDDPDDENDDSGRDGMTAPPPRDVPAPPQRTVLIIDTIRSRQATLEIASRDPTKLPRTFLIHDLEMQRFGGNEPAPFKASLTNPKPEGRIDTEGTFGPWRADDPRLTPVSGEYLFGGADLDTIKGIGGILSSGGTYRGVLERIEVSGHTETPGFHIDLAGRPVPLTTTFEAIVDGTNGNTWLERVEALLIDTTIVAKGAVVRAREIKGRHVALDVTIDRGRIEDLMALAVKTDRTPLTGRIELDARMLIPAGDEDVIEKMELDGSFSLAQARFSNVDVQRQINLLSTRGQGDEKADGSGPSVVSNLNGRFVMREAALRFSSLTFSVPGATIELAGTYNLRTEAMDFRGNALFDASLADMTSGFKSLAARIVQPFFRRPGGGSRMPIRITGTRSAPEFGLDVRRAFFPG